MGGHFGFNKIFHKLKRDFYWPRQNQMSKPFFKACDICHVVKIDNTLPSGLLQPLHIPQKPWTNIMMDFLEGLSMSGGFNPPWIIVDRFAKYAHFMPIFHPYIARVVAQLFMKHILKLHGCWVLLYKIGTPPVPTSFGRSYSPYRVFAWLVA